MQEELSRSASNELLHQKFARSIATTLHTISQPLTLVQCALELLGTQDQDPIEQEGNVRLANEQVERLIHLLEYMRALTRAYRAPASEEVCALALVLDEIVQDLSPVFKESKKKLTFRCSLEERDSVAASVNTFREEMFRLLGAANTLTDIAGEVEVRLFQQEGFGVIRIAQIGNCYAKDAPTVNTEEIFGLAEAFFANGRGAFTAEMNPLAFTCKLPLMTRSEQSEYLPNPALELLPEVSQ